MRWRQTLNKATGKHEFIPVDDAARKSDGGHFVQGDIQSFVSPIDGSIITDRKQLREHNKRNDVVSADEFTPEFYAGKAKEREDFFAGKKSKKELLKRKAEIYETWVRAERGN